MTGIIKCCAKELVLWFLSREKNIIKFYVRNHSQRFLDDELDKWQEDYLGGDENKSDCQASSCTQL